MPGASIKRDGAAPAGEPRPQTPRFGRGKVRGADRNCVERVPRGQGHRREPASRFVDHVARAAPRPAKAASG